MNDYTAHTGADDEANDALTRIEESKMLREPLDLSRDYDAECARL